MSASVDDGDSSPGAEFEVFLSFRGPDTRFSFTDCLYHSLVKAGIRVFRDNEDIRQGEKIGDELLHSIKSSKIYVPIFSRNYASSVWCLRELTHMVECSSKAKDKMILPVFYDVDPDDVKLRTPLYLDALEKHQEKFSCDVPQWKEALTEVARIRGLGLKNKGHGEIINTIIDEVLTKLMKRSRNLPDHLVGMDDQVEAIMDLLNKGSRGVRYVVIHGMGGIGKTTLASAVFNRISDRFEGCSFLSDVRESTQRGRIIDLQKQLLSEILQGRSPEIHNSVDAGINMIRERVRNKKVLLVLDDVDKWDQLSKLAGKSDWFGPGSKIIITTRDINFLPIKEEDAESSSNQACSEEFKIYEMAEMDSSDALILFSQHALGMDSPPPQYEDISLKITKRTGGLPLALEVIGSSLFGKNRTIWKDTLKKLDSTPKQEIFNKLKVSYDMLDHAQRQIFLDIACYFIRKERFHPYYMWKASGYFPKIDVLVLARMSLIKIEEDDRLWMHDQLRDLGREIIQQEDIDVPGKRSRLWLPKVALDVVRMKEGTDKVVALRLKRLPKVYNFTSEEFSKLPNLRFLELEGGNLVGDFKNLLSKLTWLSWRDCPFELNATNLFLKKLAVLEISGNITEDWAGWEQFLVSENLKVIHIAYCPRLKRTPDFSKCKNLKRLVLQGCTPSLEVDGSLSKLEHLKHLTISQACLLEISFSPFMIPIELPYSVNTLPDSIGKLKSLLELDLNSMIITELPRSIGDLKMLKKMSLCYAPIRKLPYSIGGLESLIELDLTDTPIVELPACIGDLKRLENLYLSQTEIRELPKTIGMLENLKMLEASCCDLEGEIPSEIGGLRFLRMLDLSGTKIRRLPTTMNQLSHLQQLKLGGCNKLEQIPELPVNLKELEFPPHLLWTAPDLSYLTTLVDLYIEDKDFYSEDEEEDGDVYSEDEEEDRDVYKEDANLYTEDEAKDETPQLSEFRNGFPKIEWIDGLSSLTRLKLIMRDVTFPPINFFTLSQLRALEITCVDPRSLTGLSPSLEQLSLVDVQSPMEWSLFSSLTNLSSLELRDCRLREFEFDDVLGQQLVKLDRLDVRGSESLERLSVSALTGLQTLTVGGCPGLMEIQGLEKLESLKVLSISVCSSLKRLPDLSGLKKLRRLDLLDCPLQNLRDLRLQDTCCLEVMECGFSPDFIGDYKRWKDNYGHSGDDLNSQL